MIRRLHDLGAGDSLTLPGAANSGTDASGRLRPQNFATAPTWPFLTNYPQIV